MLKKGKSKQFNVSSKSPKSNRFNQLQKFKKSGTEHTNKILKLMGLTVLIKK